jgi:predicted O-methyltransferase YrrM
MAREDRPVADEWQKTDAYVEDLFSLNDPVLKSALEASRTAGLPEINVSPAQGRMLHVLAAASGARRILEIGTLGGYSTICLARALPPGGHLTTLEVDATHARVATSNIARAGLSAAVSVVVGPALETLPTLSAPSFDFIFIDADKPSYPAYLSWALRLSHPGTLIVADNVVRGGAVANAQSADPRVQGMQQFLQMLADEPRVSATVVQTVGSKGYDGFAIAVVK